MSDGADRHAPLALIESYLAQRVNGVLNVDGDPPARILIESQSRVISLRVPFDGDEVDVAAYARLDSRLINDEGVEWQQLSVRLDDNVEDVYPILTGIIDRVQLLHETLHAATRQVLDSLETILSLRSHLSRDQQVGMWGELLVLLSLAFQSGPEVAIGAWRGARGEEHDFDLGKADLELKTTQSERRRHWISSSTQLHPTNERLLHLLSLQITAAGSTGGASLPVLVDAARKSFANSADVFEKRIREAGYRDVDAALYQSRWRLRAEPQFYEVGSDFPAITQVRIDEVIPAPERIVDLRYQIDLTGLAPSSALFEITDLAAISEDSDV
jgi:hypothetical protein